MAVAWGPVCVGISVFVSCLCVFVAAGLDLVSWLLLLCTFVPATILLPTTWSGASWAERRGLDGGLHGGRAVFSPVPPLPAGRGRAFGEFEAAIALIARQLVEMAEQMGITGSALSQLKDYAAYLQLLRRNF